MSLPLPAVTKYLENPGEPEIEFTEFYRKFQNLLCMVNAARSDTQQLTASQKNRYLLLHLGREGSRIWNTNPMVDQVDTLGHDAFAKEIQKQFGRRLSPYKAAYDFFTRDQGENETAEEFLTALRQLTTNCDFGDQKDKLLAIRMVVGCKSGVTKRRLLTLEQIDLEETKKIMIAEESALAESASMGKNPSLHAVQGRQRRKPQNPRGSKPAEGRKCYGCGQASHLFGDPSCPANGKTCNKCGTKNHFGKMCMKRQPTEQQDAKVKKVQGMKCRPGTIRISVGISDNHRFKSAELEADSGSDSTCITQSTYRKLSPDLPLEEAAEDSLKCYNSSEVKGLKGWFLTKIQWKDRIHLDKVFVVPDSMGNILGKNFLRPLGVQIDCGSNQVYKVLEPVTQVLYKANSLDFFWIP
ncbi:MAG: hypothetical protein GY696_09315 [Gammaproteobacteria bacterium]|nr:hypothetical protein [Gammaproteobacteria bacterium]